MTDAKAAARYDAAVEGWGDRLHAAGVSMCRWFVDNGAPFTCPAGR